MTKTTTIYYNVSMEYYIKFPIYEASRLSKIRPSELKRLAKSYGYNKWPFVPSLENPIYYKTIKRSPLNQIADYVLKQEAAKTFIPVGFDKMLSEHCVVKIEPQFYEYFNNEPLNV